MPLRLTVNGREVRNPRARALAGAIALLVVALVLGLLALVVLPLIGIAAGIAVIGAAAYGGRALLRRPRTERLDRAERRRLPR